MKIEWNKENNTISVGKAVFSSYKRFINSAAWAKYVLQANGLPSELSTYAKNRKEANKVASDALGCSRAVLFRHFNALQLKVFVAPIYDILKKVAFSRKGFDTNILTKINNNRNMIEQVYKDGLYNILPIVVESENSPQYLKKNLKGAWKIIANNSLNKNKSLAKAVRGLSDLSRMQAIAGIPTTVLQNFKQASADEMHWIANHFKGKWNKPAEVNRQAQLFRDARYMANQLAQDVNPNWTPRRLKEEHDRMCKEITARKYSKDVFDSVKDIPCKALKSGEYVATLLDSAFLIADEGNSMGHCVAGYADQVRQGDYLVYSVTKDGERSSTIGINKRQTSFDVIGSHPETRTYWYLQQQYGRYNAHVKDEEERKLAAALVGLLNKQSLTEV